MRAIQLLAPGIVELVELPVPSIGPGELLLEMRVCGLCGSDLAKIFSEKPMKRPVPLGHELVGVVKAVGEGVQRFAPGDRLAVAHHVPCGRCRYCRHGSESMCPQFRATNIDPGGFAEFVRIPALQTAQTAFALPEKLPDEVGIFMEPLACALRAVKRSNVQAGDRIVVVGAGCMGLLIAQAVAISGARPICVDLREERLELARTLGVEATLNVAGSDPRMALRSVTEEDGIDGAILIAVSGPMIEAVLGVLRAGGKINLFADAGDGSRMAVDLSVFYRQELSLTATYSATPVELGKAIQLLASGQIQTFPLISHRLDLSRFDEGARLQREGQAMKVLFHPGGKHDMIPVNVLSRTMVAAVLHGPEDVRLEEVPIPQLGPKDLLARVEAASLDFTDRKVYLRGSHPMIEISGLFGHEWAGIVVARGEQADVRWQPGMRVVAANSAPCTDPSPSARCRACRRSRQGMCERLLYNNGAFAPYIRIPGRIAEVNLHELPQQVPFEEAALAEPLACVMHAIRRVQISDGDRVVIMGAGSIGLMFIAVLHNRYGQSIRLLSLDHHDDRLDLARSFGADEALNTAGGPLRAGVREAFGAEKADVVIEAVGSMQAHQEAFGLLGRGGTLVSFGGVAGGTILSLDLHRLHYEEIRIVPIYHHTPDDFASAVHAIVHRKVPVARLITARLSLVELPRALEMVQERTTLRTTLFPWGRPDD